MPTLKNLKDHFSKVTARRDSALSKFKEELDKNPTHALIWSQATMQAVAQGGVADHHLQSIKTWEELRAKGELGDQRPQTEEAVVAFIYESILRTALRSNSHVERSTSVTSNFMKAEENAFYADLASNWDCLLF
jgi:hypothetical protein